MLVHLAAAALPGELDSLMFDIQASVTHQLCTIASIQMDQGVAGVEEGKSLLFSPSVFFGRMVNILTMAWLYISPTKGGLVWV